MEDFERVIEESKNLTRSIIGMYAEQIEKAFKKNGGGSYAVNLGFKLTPDGEDVKVEASIAFTEGKVKDSIQTVVSDQQEIPGI